MKRRAVLGATASAGVATLAGLSGCLDFASDVAGIGRDGERTAVGRAGPGSGGEESYPSLAETGFPPTVCEESTQPWALLEIDDPAFAREWPVDVDQRYASNGVLGDEQVVVGLTGGDRPRAYPVAVLWFHEVVEDEYAGEPVLVTYCSLCRSGMVASRVVDDRTLSFRASGLLWRPEGVFVSAAEEDNRSFGATVLDADIGVRNAGNLVLVDQESGSYWSQLLARGICGRYEYQPLTILPSAVATWGDWRSEHPDTEVLLPPPHSGIDETGSERRN